MASPVPAEQPETQAADAPADQEAQNQFLYSYGYPGYGYAYTGYPYAALPAIKAVGKYLNFVVNLLTISRECNQFISSQLLSCPHRPSKL